MAESKSAEFTSKINEPSEFSLYVHPLRALVNFPRSECRDPVTDARWDERRVTSPETALSVDAKMLAKHVQIPDTQPPIPTLINGGHLRCGWPQSL
jgi:hypothetical protein